MPGFFIWLLLQAELEALAEPVPVTSASSELPGSELEEAVQNSDAGIDDKCTVTHDPYQNDACYI